MIEIPVICIVLALAEEDSLDDVELARKIKKGDEAAFKIFFNRHYDPLLRFLLSKNLTTEVAEDLIQNAFLYIWDHRKKIEPEKSLRAYLFRIGYTRMLNHFRDTQKVDNTDAVPESSTDLTPEDHLRSSELKEAVDQAINGMPKKRREVFQLCFMQELTYKEAAKVMDITRKTVENHMGLAFKDIRAALKHFNS